MVIDLVVGTLCLVVVYGFLFLFMRHMGRKRQKRAVEARMAEHRSLAEDCDWRGNWQTAKEARKEAEKTLEEYEKDVPENKKSTYTLGEANLTATGIRLMMEMQQRQVRQEGLAQYVPPQNIVYYGFDQAKNEPEEKGDDTLLEDGKRDIE